jgi:hypothetical protein
MAASVDLIIRVITDTKKASSDISSAGSSVSGFAAGVKKAAVPAAIALAGIAAGAATAAASASRTEQAMGGIDSVFGKSAGQMKKWSDQAAESAGLAKSEYGELATIIGSQLKNAGLPMQDVADQTNALIQKGADLSAMFGGTAADAVSALSSVLKGETDPIEAYGVSIKQADIAAQKAKDGTDKLTGAAGKQATAMAALKLVNEQTAAATGKFASESDTAAGSAQITQAKMENLKSQMGTALLPVLAALTSAFGVAFGFMAKHTTTFQILAAVIAVVAAGILVLNVALSIMAIAEAVALAPIILIVLAIAALVAIVIIVIKNFDTLKAAAFAVWGAIQSAFQSVVNFASGAASTVAGVWTAAWDKIKGAVSAVFDWVKSHWPLLVAILAGPIGIAVGLIVSHWDRIKSTAQTAFGFVKTAIGWVSSALDTMVGWLGKIKIPGNMDGPFATLKTAVGHVSGALDTMIGWLGKIVVPGGMGGAFDTLKSAIDRVIGAVQSLIGWLGKIHVPNIHIPHVGGKSAAAAAPAIAAPSGVGAPRVMSRGAATSTTSGGVTINVTGAVDPEATARQIRRILGGHDRRVGLAT